MSLLKDVLFVAVGFCEYCCCTDSGAFSHGSDSEVITIGSACVDVVCGAVLWKLLQVVFPAGADVVTV